MFNNEYFIGFYGWVFFNIVLLGFAKDKLDEKKRRFNFRIWWRYHWDNVAVTLFSIPVIVAFSTDLWVLIVNEWFSKDWEYSKLSLLGAVPFTQLIYFFIGKIKK
mgnify:CR=1 FL=1